MHVFIPLITEAGGNLLCSPSKHPQAPIYGPPPTRKASSASTCVAPSGVCGRSTPAPPPLVLVPVATDPRLEADPA